MSHFEQRLGGESKFHGKIIDVIHDTVLLENGKQALREVARHPGAVGILVLEGDQLVLVRQFRYPIGKELLEIPAGKLEKGEDPYPAALRELREETGIVADEAEFQLLETGREGNIHYDYYCLHRETPLSKIVLLPGETDSVQWASFGKVRWMIHAGKICKIIGHQFYRHEKALRLRNFNKITR